MRTSWNTLTKMTGSTTTSLSWVARTLTGWSDRPPTLSLSNISSDMELILKNLQTMTIFARFRLCWRILKLQNQSYPQSISSFLGTVREFKKWRSSKVISFGIWLCILKSTSRRWVSTRQTIFISKNKTEILNLNPAIPVIALAILQTTQTIVPKVLLRRVSLNQGR